MKSYEEIIKEIKQKPQPKVSAELWSRIESTLAEKEASKPRFFNFPSLLLPHPVLKTVLVCSVIVLLFTFSIGQYQKQQIGDFLLNQFDNIDLIGTTTSFDLWGSF